MREFFTKLVRAFIWLDTDPEFAIAGILAALLLLIGPPMASFLFLRAGHDLAAATSGGVWILMLIASVRDFRRGYFGWVSMALGLVWFIMTLAVVWKVEAL
jgi:hypothetical protein